MYKLLRADISRLWRSKCLWICAACAILLSVGSAALNISVGGSSVNIGDGPFRDFPNIVIIISVFVPIFLGTEYSDHTIRNKLTVGAKRTHIYLASLLSSIVGALLITAAGSAYRIIKYIAAAVKYNTKGIGSEPMPTERFVWGLAACVSAVIAACAFLTLLGMLITKKSSGIVWSVFIMILLYGASMFIGFRLKENEMVFSSHMGDDGYFTNYEWKKNDRYVSGFPRMALGSLYSVIPFGAFDQANEGFSLLLYTDNYDMYNDVDNLENGDGLWSLPIYSLGAAVVTSAIGTSVFRRKEIK